MRAFVTSLLAAAALAVTPPASAAIVVGTFSGTVTQGEAIGNFGFDTATDLTGLRITGTFRYDTDLLGPDCAPGLGYLGCFLGTGMSITQTINGVDEIFPGSQLPPESGPEFNIARSGLVLYDLIGDTANLHTFSMLGTPASVYNEREAGVAFGLAPGASGDTGNPVLTYAGAADGKVDSYMLEDQFLQVNRSRIFQITGGFVTQQTTYAFTVDQATFSAAVPEPGAWALMIVGFATAGAALRRRQRILVRLA